MEIIPFLLPEVIVNKKGELFEVAIIKWFGYFKKEELYLRETIRQEMELNITEQFGENQKLY